jgi:hypothetical protein
MKAYPERPYGETEQGFYDRLAGLTLADLSLDDFRRWAAYEYLAGGLVQLSPMTRLRSWMSPVRPNSPARTSQGQTRESREAEL